MRLQQIASVIPRLRDIPDNLSARSLQRLSSTVKPRFIANNTLYFHHDKLQAHSVPTAQVEVEQGNLWHRGTNCTTIDGHRVPYTI